MNKPEPQDIFVDLTRSIAIIAVVVLHVCAPISYEFGRTSLAIWETGDLIESATRPAVPLFFMLSGLLLLPKLEPLTVFFRKRAARVLIPLFFWSLFYLLLNNKDNLAALGLSDLLTVFYKPAKYHLWFMYVLLGLYIGIPMLRLAARGISDQMLLYGLGLWFLAASVIPQLELVWGFSSPYQLDVLSGFSGYLFAGLYLGRRPLTRGLVLSAGLVALVSYAAIVMLTFYASRNAGVFVHTYYEYLSAPVILYSLAAFVLLRAFAAKLTISPGGATWRLIRQFSEASFGIYLAHVFMLRLVGKFSPHFMKVFQGPTALAIALTSVAALVLSFAFIRAADRVPGLRRITG